MEVMVQSLQKAILGWILENNATVDATHTTATTTDGTTVINNRHMDTM